MGGMGNFCAYNIRGVNKKVPFAQDFIRDNNIGIIALLETHVKQASTIFVSESIHPDFCWHFNYPHHDNGHIWIGWNPVLWNVTPLKTEDQHVACEVTCLSNNEKFLVSFIYALNSAVQRRSLWHSLSQFHDYINISSACLPLIALGGFNVCLNINENCGGSSAITSGMTEFRDCINSLSLVDLYYTGQFLTWWDKRNIQKKLDRALVNPAWLDSFRNSNARFLQGACQIIARW